MVGRLTDVTLACTGDNISKLTKAKIDLGTKHFLIHTQANYEVALVHSANISLLIAIKRCGGLSFPELTLATGSNMWV